jgi:hypothetical protein
VVIPKVMADATVASLPLQVGIYTTFVPMLIWASVRESSAWHRLMAAFLDLQVSPGNARRVE